MAAYSIVLLCFLLILNQSSSLVNATVEGTCKAAGGDYNFCVATLNADRGSASADNQGLAVIATKLTKVNATSTESAISSLLKKQNGNATQRALDDCSSMYSDLIDNLDAIVGYIESKRYGDANIFLSAAVDVGDNCETGFSELNVPSPLTNENNDTRRLSSLALAITTLLG